MQKIQFNYFRGMEGDQYTFYRIPKILFTAECFRVLSCEAKVLYGLLLDRMSLSIKNRWIDEQDRVYIIFTVEDIAELMNCGTQKAVKLLQELDDKKGIGLIEKKRLGLGKPNVIFVKNFMISEQEEEQISEKTEENAVGILVSSQNSENHNSGVVKTTIQEVRGSQFKNDENHNSGNVKTTIQEVPESQFKNREKRHSRNVETIIQEIPKSQSNNTDINNTDFSETEINLSYPSDSEQSKKQDKIEQMKAYRELIREKISYYECYPEEHQRKDIDELIDLIVEVLMMPDDARVRIGGEEKPVSIVKSQFMKLNYSHMEYVQFCLSRNTSKVGNIKSYLLTTLYNSLLTISHFYQAEVNHDMYGG